MTEYENSGRKARIEAALDQAFRFGTSVPAITKTKRKWLN